MTENNECRVVACGYRHIRSTKTGLTFPAWLVQMPGGGPQLWRSKRDFLLLGRASAKEINDTRLPKAALEKLSRRAPWKRPMNDSVVPHCLSEEAATTNSYHVSMKKSIHLVDQFLQKVIIHVDENPSTELGRAWEWFCRHQDTEHLTVQDHVPADEHKSSQLGQYFCTPENASQLVHAVLERVEWKTKRRMVFLEPSCGHGDVVRTLVMKLERRNISRGYVSIVACDIDSQAIQACKATMSISEVIPVQYCCHDFLTTQPGQFGITESDTVVCLGGPPYTSGAGSGTEMKRDLCQLFLKHAVQEYKASVVAFFLPQRYKTNPLLQQNEAIQWVCETQELDSSTFFFQGKKPVVQPSILQCWHHKERATTAS